MAIARFPSFVLDCPDPAALATFYGTMLDWKVTDADGWFEIRADYGQCICFQKVDDYTAPVWPGQDSPQQMHIDVVVDDLDAAEVEVIAHRGHQARAPARDDVQGVPRPGRSPVLPVPQLRPAERRGRPATHRLVHHLERRRQQHLVARRRPDQQLEAAGLHDPHP